MKAPLCILALSLSLSNLAASCTPKVFTSESEIPTITFINRSILCLKLNFFKNYAAQNMWGSGRRMWAIEMLKNRCDILFLVAESPSDTLDEKELKYISEEYPDIDAIVIIHEKNKAILKEYSLFKDTLRIVYLNEDMVPFELQEKLNPAMSPSKQRNIATLWDDLFSLKQKRHLYEKKYSISNFQHLLPLVVEAQKSK